MNKYTRIDWTKLKPQPVIGVDEAGRGCLAGPVFASAVLFIPKTHMPTPMSSANIKKQMKNQAPFTTGDESPHKTNPFTHSETEEPYPDSKQISSKEREKLSQIIQSRHIWAVGLAHVEEIEQLNILKASLLSMKRAIMACWKKRQTLLAPVGGQKPHILVDGNALIPDLPSYFHQTAFIKGDQRLSPIASASIIAKVTRDKWISQQAEKYPQYNFARHKGYATLQHKQAIAEYGPCPLHRKHFTGVREHITNDI